MKKNVLVILATLLVCCIVQPTARAMDQPAKIVGKLKPSVRDVTKVMQDLGPLVLDNEKQIAVSITSTGEPLVVVGGNALENVSVDKTKEKVSAVVGTTDEETGLFPVMNVEFTQSVTGGMVIQTTAADGSDVHRYHVTYTESSGSSNLIARDPTVMRVVCTCYGGATVPKRACLATECTDPAECATGPQPSQAHCKDMEAALIPQPGDKGPVLIRSQRDNVNTVQPTPE